MVYYNSEKYVGEFKEGKRHGQGTITLPDGSTLVLKNGNKQPMVYQNYSRGINQDDILNDPPKPVIDNILYFTNYSWFQTSCCNNNSCECFNYQEVDKNFSKKD